MENPSWLEEARELCRRAGIKIAGWGPDMLTVEANSPDRAREIASELGRLGFKAVESEDDTQAGMLSLSRNPAAVIARIASFDVSRRGWGDQIQPLLWAVCSALLLLPQLNTGRNSRWFTLPLGVFVLVMFFLEGSRIWGWKLQLLPDALRVRRRFRWSTIPWPRISAVESKHARRFQESVLVKLASRGSERLGTFNYLFARNLRDRLLYELAQRRHQAH